jgi:hypothetical protein
MKSRVAWVAQDFIDPPPWNGEGEPPALKGALWEGKGAAPPLGKARGHVDPDNPVDPESPQASEQGEWDTVEEAIAWARERAERVYVRVGNSDYYNAGEVHSPDFKPWPPTEEAIRYETWRGPFT